MMGNQLERDWILWGCTGDLVRCHGLLPPEHHLNVEILEIVVKGFDYNYFLKLG